MLEYAVLGGHLTTVQLLLPRIRAWLERLRRAGAAAVSGSGDWPSARIGEGRSRRNACRHGAAAAAGAVPESYEFQVQLWPRLQVCPVAEDTAGAGRFQRQTLLGCGSFGYFYVVATASAVQPEQPLHTAAAGRNLVALKETDLDEAQEDMVSLEVLAMTFYCWRRRRVRLPFTAVLEH